MIEPGSDIVNMLRISCQATALFPLRVHFGLHIIEHVDCPEIKNDFLRKIQLQLCNADVSDIGPDTQNIGEMRNMNRRHLYIKNN